MNMIFVITLGFGVLILASASWLGKIYLQLFYRVGFTLVALYFRNRQESEGQKSFEVSYTWRKPFPFWQLMASSLLALFVLLKIAEPVVNQHVEPVGWLGIFLAGWGSVWLASPGTHFFLGLTYQMHEGENLNLEAPEDTLCTGLAHLILGRVKALIAITLLTLALLCVLHASVPYVS